ncbi:MAG: hypothetical protein ACR2IF_10230 [Terriglobales bacterium]
MSRFRSVIAASAVVLLALACTATSLAADTPAPQKPAATPLQIDQTTLRGTMVEVRGRTHPDAEVTVNGRPAVVTSDGHFSCFTASNKGAVTIIAEKNGMPSTTITIKPKN